MYESPVTNSSDIPHLRLTICVSTKAKRLPGKVLSKAESHVYNQVTDRLSDVTHGVKKGIAYLSLSKLHPFKNFPR